MASTHTLKSTDRLWTRCPASDIADPSGLTKNCSDNGCAGKTHAHMEWQKHQSDIRDEITALTGHTNFPICLWNLDPYSRATEENTEHGDETLQKTHGHLIHPTCHKWESLAKDQPSHWPTWWPALLCHKAETEVVRTYHQILRPC